MNRIILIVGNFPIYDANGQSTGKTEYLVSHGIDEHTLKNVILPNEHPAKLGATYDHTLQEWVLEIKEIVEPPKYYTGVGSRKTPKEILDLMYKIAAKAALCGYTLRSGGAEGADKAFEQGCDSVKGSKNIYYAKDATDIAISIAARYHPAWNNCSLFAKRLHGRNSFQILGDTLDTPSYNLVCWTPDGCINHDNRNITTGGTGTAISIAYHYNVPIYNLYHKTHRNVMNEWLNS